MPHGQNGPQPKLWIFVLHLWRYYWHQLLRHQLPKALQMLEEGVVAATGSHDSLAAVLAFESCPAVKNIQDEKLIRMKKAQNGIELYPLKR